MTEIIARVDAGERPTAPNIIREIESDKKETAEAKQPPRRRGRDTRQRQTEGNRVQGNKRREAHPKRIK